MRTLEKYRVLGGNQQRKRVRLPMRMTMGVGVGPVEMNHAVAALLSGINRMQEFPCLPPVVHRGRVRSRAPQAETVGSGRKKGWFRGGAAVEGVVVVELGRPIAGPEARALNPKQTTIGGPSAGRVRGRRPRVDNNRQPCLRTIGRKAPPRPTCPALARFGPHALRRRHVAAHSKTGQ